MNLRESFCLCFGYLQSPSNHKQDLHDIFLRGSWQLGLLVEFRTKASLADLWYVISEVLGSGSGACGSGFRVQGLQIWFNPQSESQH